MPNRWIPYVKALVHLVCLLPFLELLQQYRSGAFGLMADPVNYITHQTGYWTLFLLITTLAVTPVRRLHPKLANLIRFRRLLGLYAFFYATLHLATYLFLFSGYDLPTVWAGLRAGHPSAIVDEWKAVWPTILDARALGGVRGGCGRMRPLLVAGEEGCAGAAAIYAGADRAAAGASGVDCDASGEASRRRD